MMHRSTVALLALLTIPAAAAAQHGTAAAPRSFTAPSEASQFDFLIGQWELDVRPQVSGLAARIHGAPRLTGTWKAWRAFDGWGIEDEMRIVDGSGNPASLAHSLRAFDATGQNWTLALLDVYRGRISTATAQWRDGQMQAGSRGTDQEGHAYLSRTRFFDITANGFKYQQERSTDEGRTWSATLTIEARRVAATAPR